VLKALDKNEGYSLAHLYRHPAEKEPKWQLSRLHVSGEEGTIYFPGLWISHCKRFKNRPGNKELYASLSWEDVGWSFGQEKGWKFVSCCVCENNWLAVIGETPTQFFGRWSAVSSRRVTRWQRQCHFNLASQPKEQFFFGKPGGQRSSSDSLLAPEDLQPLTCRPPKASTPGAETTIST